MIDEGELEISAARSSGPGGQHVNKTETKVVLSFAVDESGSASPEQKSRLRENLANRLTRDGRLKLSSQRYRSRAANERDVRDRFARLIERGLRPPAVRKETKVPRSQQRRRLEQKRQRSRVKRLRTTPPRNGEDS